MIEVNRYRATGYDRATDCAEMINDPEGAWVHVEDVKDLQEQNRKLVEMLDRFINYKAEDNQNGTSLLDNDELWEAAENLLDVIR